jgi:hypothetical protein
MKTRFTKLNHGWNAEPNCPNVEITVEDDTLTLSFRANPYLFPQFVNGQIIQLRFSDVWRYSHGGANLDGWHMGQCRFSGIAPSWGEFYEVDGDLRLDQFSDEWCLVTNSPKPNLKHFLFYFRDDTFECDAVSWERIQ